MMNAVLTGQVQIGKTTVCQAVADLARERGYCVRGILTPPILDRDGERLGIEVLDLASGERKVLAQIRRAVPESGNAPERDGARLQGDFSGPQVGIYEFDAAALQWGQDVVARAIAVGCDLLIVDEIGRLELQQGIGFNQVLNLLETSVVLRSLLVVRAELLDLFQQRLPSLQFISFEVTQDNRYSLPFEIADRFFLA